MKRILSFLSVGLLSVGLVACSDSNGSNNTSSEPKKDTQQNNTKQEVQQQPTQPSNTPAPTPTPAPEPPKNSPKMSKAEFDQIQNGMSYEEVTAIIGGEGEVISESGEKGSLYYTVMYQYEGEGSLGANANLMFQSGKLQNKAQFGLK